MDFGRTLRYPTERNDWLTAILIGGLLTFLGFLVLPLVLVSGYLVRVIKDTQAARTRPPEFGDWDELLVDGFKAWAIGFVYLLVSALVAVVTIGGSMAVGADGNASTTAGPFLAGMSVSALMAVVFGYIATAAVVNFARKDEFSAAFDFDMLRQIVFHRDYATAWIVSLVVVFAAGFVAAIPFAGWVVLPFASFYALTVAANLWSSGISAALDSTETGSHVSGEQPMP